MIIHHFIKHYLFYLTYKLFSQEKSYTKSTKKTITIKYVFRKVKYFRIFMQSLNSIFKVKDKIAIKMHHHKNHK